MSPEAIPNDDEWLPVVTPDFNKEIHKVHDGCVVGQNLEVFVDSPGGLKAQGSNGRKFLPTAFLSQNGCLSDGCPGGPHERLLAKATFI